MKSFYYGLVIASLVSSFLYGDKHAVLNNVKIHLHDKQTYHIMTGDIISFTHYTIGTDAYPEDNTYFKVDPSGDARRIIDPAHSTIEFIATAPTPEGKTTSITIKRLGLVRETFHFTIEQDTLRKAVSRYFGWGKIQHIN